MISGSGGVFSKGKILARVRGFFLRGERLRSSRLVSLDSVDLKTTVSSSVISPPVPI